jgi:hypothetical protein
MRYCLESARVIAQTLPDVATVQMAGTDSKFYTFTPFACPIMLAGYTFLMLRHKADTCGSPAEPGHGNRELRGECDRGAASCMDVLDGFSQAWLHLGDAASELTSLSSNFPSHYVLEEAAANFCCSAYERSSEISLNFAPEQVTLFGK